MKRWVIVVAWALLGGGCSNSSSNICCLDINGAQSYWQCPTAAAESACCNNDSNNVPGCLDTPIDPAASSCTNNASPSDCP